MNCPICQNPTTSVTDSRKRETHVMRRRKCQACGHGFTTSEIIGDTPQSDDAIRKLQTERDRAVGALYAIWSSGDVSLSRIRSAIGIDSLTAIITETAQAKGKLKQKV